jgi:hypothetical protein
MDETQVEGDNKFYFGCVEIWGNHLNGHHNIKSLSLTES